MAHRHQHKGLSTFVCPFQVHFSIITLKIIDKNVGCKSIAKLCSR